MGQKVAEWYGENNFCHSSEKGLPQLLAERLQRKGIHMPSRKIIKFSRETAHSGDREEFFSLPRAEYLLEDGSGTRRQELGKMVINSRFESADRISLKVEDNRMAGIGIRKGDNVIVEKRHHYADSDVLAVQVGSRVFIRKFFQKGRRIRLECTSPERQTMILDKETPGFAILGVISQVIREI